MEDEFVGFCINCIYFEFFSKLKGDFRFKKEKKYTLSEENLSYFINRKSNICQKEKAIVVKDIFC